MAREQNIQQETRLHLSKQQIGVFFRVNVGQAWTGNTVEKLPGRKVLIHDARPFSTGLPKGFSDLFGITAVTITPDMVGKTVGICTAIEMKKPGQKGRATKDQINFLRMIANHGGHAGVATSPQEAEGIARGELLL